MHSVHAFDFKDYSKILVDDVLASNSSQAFERPKPMLIMKAIVKPSVKEIVHRILTSCPVPVFLPILYGHIIGADLQGDGAHLDSKATPAVAAMMLVLFARKQMGVRKRVRMSLITDLDKDAETNWACNRGGRTKQREAYGRGIAIIRASETRA